MLIPSFSVPIIIFWLSNEFLPKGFTQVILEPSFDSHKTFIICLESFAYKGSYEYILFPEAAKNCKLSSNVIVFLYLIGH